MSDEELRDLLTKLLESSGLESLKGADGKDGKDGKTPEVTLSEDGYLYIDNEKQEPCLIGPKGEDGIAPTITVDDDGYIYIDDEKQNGFPFVKIHEGEISIPNHNSIPGKEPNDIEFNKLINDSLSFEDYIAFRKNIYIGGGEEEFNVKIQLGVNPDNNILCYSYKVKDENGVETGEIGYAVDIFLNNATINGDNITFTGSGIKFEKYVAFLDGAGDVEESELNNETTE